MQLTSGIFTQIFCMLLRSQFAALVKNPGSKVIDAGLADGLERIMLNSIIPAMSSRICCSAQREPGNNDLLRVTSNSILSS